MPRKGDPVSPIQDPGHGATEALSPNKSEVLTPPPRPPLSERITPEARAAGPRVVEAAIALEQLTPNDLLIEPETALEVWLEFKAACADQDLDSGEDASPSIESWLRFVASLEAGERYRGFLEAGGYSSPEELHRRMIARTDSAMEALQAGPTASAEGGAAERPEKEKRLLELVRAYYRDEENWQKKEEYRQQLEAAGYRVFEAKAIDKTLQTMVERTFTLVPSEIMGFAGFEEGGELFIVPLDPSLAQAGNMDTYVDMLFENSGTRGPAGGRPFPKDFRYGGVGRTCRLARTEKPGVYRLEDKGEVMVLTKEEWARARGASAVQVEAPAATEPDINRWARQSLERNFLKAGFEDRITLALVGATGPEIGGLESAARLALIGLDGIPMDDSEAFEVQEAKIEAAVAALEAKGGAPGPEIISPLRPVAEMSEGEWQGVKDKNLLPSSLVGLADAVREGRRRGGKLDPRIIEKYYALTPDIQEVIRRVRSEDIVELVDKVLAESARFEALRSASADSGKDVLAEHPGQFPILERGSRAFAAVSAETEPEKVQEAEAAYVAALLLEIISDRESRSGVPPAGNPTPPADETPGTVPGSGGKTPPAPRPTSPGSPARTPDDIRRPQKRAESQGEFSFDDRPPTPEQVLEDPGTTWRDLNHLYYKGRWKRAVDALGLSPFEFEADPGCRAAGHAASRALGVATNSLKILKTAEGEARNQAAREVVKQIGVIFWQIKVLDEIAKKRRPEPPEPKPEREQFTIESALRFLIGIRRANLKEKRKEGLTAGRFLLAEARAGRFNDDELLAKVVAHVRALTKK